MFFKLYRKTIVTLLILLFAMQSTTIVYAADFSDVPPPPHWAYSYINKLRELNITNGIGNNMFGMGQTITRAEFVTFLCNLMKWETNATSGSFIDNQDTDAWYYQYVETALANGAIKSDTALFRPEEPITREEMAVMLVLSLGYDELANSLVYLGSPFTDVTRNTGYITIAKDLGIISGMGNNTFMPYSTATREQAATMMIRMYEGLNRGINFKNGFYAINSSSQMNSINGFDSMSFGWGKLELDGDSLTLNTTSKNNNEYRLPNGYEDPYGMAAGKTRMLMIAVDAANAHSITTDSNLRRQAISIMADSADGITDPNGNKVAFDGVVVDIETLKGDVARDDFNTLLKSLRAELDKTGKKMYVAVHPQRREGQEYYNGYDYKTIGRLSDKVILMAHDYNAKRLTEEDMAQGIVTTPLSPIEEVYYALRAVTDENTGVEDKSKIVLQISFGTAQWKLRDGKVTEQFPYTPSYDMMMTRIQSGAAEMKYSKKFESPYLTFFNSEDNTDNIVWYEDERSVNARIKLSELFGVTGISVWRLGIIPDFGRDNYLDVINDIIKK